MARERTTKPSKAGEAYVKKLNFGRKIHEKLDDGALLALCEYYGEGEDENGGEDDG